MTSLSSTEKYYPKLGDGVYFAYDVAEILNLKYNKVRALMTGYWQSYTFGSDGSRAINFISLIEFFIFYHLREQNWTNLEIKRLHARLAKSFNTKHPFASLKLLSFPKNHPKQKGELWMEFKDELMKADGALQPVFKEFIQPYLQQIEFGDNSIAKRYFPIYGINKSKNIVVDPMHQFGQPVISGTNIQTATIYSLVEAGETKKNISLQYNIEEKIINDVLVYYEKRA